MSSWVWAGGSPAVALTATGLPAGTPVVADGDQGVPAWPHLLPERLESGHARYDAAIAAAAARAARAAVAGEGGAATTSTAPALLLITHGEAVRRAVTRLAPTACVYEARHCGWVACVWRAGDGGDGGDDPGEWALTPGGSAGVAWLDPDGDG